ncbi:energy-coupling factor transporter transmembrane component T [Bacillus suaedaesalsae]|uniref:Energy-coupling factor transporter transmembrane protein EcfT n=1 Tax=Bacillus suaedaesalsae TaxID=2810349 RepID=A0ABS2DN47_9BACI|nr:energy-coupling factor transporter transmembrane component T [Bacillus suaedaesalsae]MBM6619913.1 energy-coupling factor transporter transmembrane protein EcfT [Bacillus suaedaesalsae]
MYYSFDRFHPFVTFLYYVASITAFTLCMHPFFIIVGTAIILLLNFAHDRGHALRKWIAFIITTGVIIFIMNPLFNERGLHVMMVLFNHVITLEAIIYGFMAAFSLIGVTMIFVNYNEIMTPNKLLFLFSKSLPKFSILLMLTLRFIPLMRRRLEEITNIQRSKGISLSKGKWKDKVSNGLSIVQVLTTFSLEEAIQTADSMNARGYGTNQHRTSYNHFIFKKKDLFLAIIVLSLLLMIILGRVNGAGHLTVYPVMDPLLLSLHEEIILLLYSVLLGIPILLKAGGYLIWRISK